MIKKLLIFFLLTFPNFSYSVENADFISWLDQFKNRARQEGISKDTLIKVFQNVKYLEKVITYDRKQPEFFEDTITYVGKRASSKRANKAKKLLQKNLQLFNEVENKFKVEKEVLLALWGVETNFGKHVGKMDIISSLATLSFDKRRSVFFSDQLITLLKLIDDSIIEIDMLYGSWAGAVGNFQFMPSTIANYAIDYDNDNKIQLKKSLKDSLASAANYINKIGWEYQSKCFLKVKLNSSIKSDYINTSAKKIRNYLTIEQWKKKGIVISNKSTISDNKKAALIMPDGNDESPAYLVFKNYEKILKWNRSLRFGITICTLTNMIKNEI